MCLATFIYTKWLISTQHAQCMLLFLVLARNSARFRILRSHTLMRSCRYIPSQHTSIKLAIQSSYNDIRKRKNNFFFSYVCACVFFLQGGMREELLSWSLSITSGRVWPGPAWSLTWSSWPLQSGWGQYETRLQTLESLSQEWQTWHQGTGSWSLPASEERITYVQMCNFLKISPLPFCE